MKKRFLQAFVIQFLIIVLVSWAQCATYYANPAATDQGATGPRTIKSLLTAIGTTKKATIVLDHTGSGTNTTYTLAQNIDASAYTNVTIEIRSGAIIARGVFTISFPAPPKAGAYQILSGTGTVTMPGEKLVEWFGAKDDSGTTDNTLPIGYALAAGGTVYLTAPSGGYYKITDTLSMSVANTKLISNNKAEIRQATTNKGGINVTASGCEIIGVKLTGPQYATQQATEKAIYAYGADASHYITDLKVKDCDINTWGMYGIYPYFVSDYEISGNKITNIYYGAILPMSSIRGRITNNSINIFARRFISDIAGFLVMVKRPIV